MALSRIALVCEFAALFVLVPLGYRLSPHVLPALPILWVAALYCYWQLCCDPAFERRQLWNAGAMKSELASILTLFLLVAAAIGAAVYWLAPKMLFGMVKSHPVLWGLIMVLYPVLSVYPQGLIYRSFLMHRYVSLWPSAVGRIAMSACAFAFMHLIFRNPLAVVLTFGGGLLFAWRYEKTRSLSASSLEHALYGCWLFTVGLGQYFYHGSIRLQ